MYESNRYTYGLISLMGTSDSTSSLNELFRHNKLSTRRTPQVK